MQARKKTGRVTVQSLAFVARFRETETQTHCGGRVDGSAAEATDDTFHGSYSHPYLAASRAMELAEMLLKLVMNPREPSTTTSKRPAEFWRMLTLAPSACVRTCPETLTSTICSAERTPPLVALAPATRSAP
jgi:hypothetical protein